jgi:hypothetical protein
MKSSGANRDFVISYLDSAARVLQKRSVPTVWLHAPGSDEAAGFRGGLRVLRGFCYTLYDKSTVFTSIQAPEEEGDRREAHDVEPEERGIPQALSSASCSSEGSLNRCAGLTQVRAVPNCPTAVLHQRLNQESGESTSSRFSFWRSYSASLFRFPKSAELTSKPTIPIVSRDGVRALAVG